MAAASRFAHLFGLGAKKAAEGDDKKECAAGEKPTQGDDESDEDFQKRLDKWKEGGGEEAAAAEGPKDTSDSDQDKEEKLKKAKADGVAEGITAERARWSGTLASTAAAGRGVAAISLLADTDLGAEAIQKTLAALPAETPRSTLAARQPTPTPAPATDAAADPLAQEGPKGFAARLTAAVEKVRPSKATKAA